MTRIAASLAALLACSAASAGEKKVYGFTISDAVELGGTTLRLNGAGVREGQPPRAVQMPGAVVYYVAALYLAVPASDMAAIVSSDAPWVMHMHYAINLSQKQIMDAFRESLQRTNPKEKLVQLLPKLDSIAPAVPDARVGQRLVLAYRPGMGTTVGMEGGAQVTVEGKDFADAMLGNWIGPKPIQGSLKKKLLGL